MLVGTEGTFRNQIKGRGYLYFQNLLATVINITPLHSFCHVGVTLPLNVSQHALKFINLSDV